MVAVERDEDHRPLPLRLRNFREMFRETEHRGTTLVELFVAPGELGKVIGRQGRTAAALRTLAATAGEKVGKTVTLEIRDGRP